MLDVADMSSSARPRDGAAVEEIAPVVVAVPWTMGPDILVEVGSPISVVAPTLGLEVKPEPEPELELELLELELELLLARACSCSSRTHFLQMRSW